MGIPISKCSSAGRAGSLTIFFSLVLLFASPAWAQVDIPDTPAGHTLAAWLEAFNSGDPELMDAYYQKYEPNQSAEAQMPFRNRTGGFELLSIEKSERLSIEFLVKGHASETRAMGRLRVEDAEPARVANSLLLRAIPPGATILGFTIDAEIRDGVIEGAVAKLEEFYVFPETADEMAAALATRQRRGEYDTVTDGGDFANLLTQHLREVSHDLHLSVNFSPARMPERPAGPNPVTVEQYRRQMERINCGFEKVERLSGNVGYLKFNMFADPGVCGSTAAAAMNFLQNVDAIIIDMRENGGGDPKMVAFVSTYLFAAPTHLNDLWTRSTDTTQQYWTLPYVPGKRLDGKPVYVLTSSRSFSGAEEFTYNLKSLGRATVVGETTGGGAHPVRGERINDQFTINVPFARAINPITKTNWEGTGVEPDINVPAADALSTAQELIAEELQRP